MPRVARKNLKSDYCHVIVQGINKEFIFENDKFKEQYKNIIKENLKEINMQIIAYCIMSNHAHILVLAEDKNVLTNFMSKVNTKYARFYNKENERVGYVFRDRYFIQMILSKDHLYNCISYIHNNPISANICKTLEDYKYSSYNEYVGKKEIISEEVIKSILGTDDEFRSRFRLISELKNLDDVIDVEKIVTPANTIIENFLLERNKTLDDIINNYTEFKKLLIKLRGESNLSLRELAKMFKMGKDKINYIIKK